LASQLLSEQLKESAKQVNVLLNKIVSVDLEPPFIYQASRHLIDAGGKRARPFLTLKSCELVGGKIEDALPVAVAIELLHTFTLIHDDIMDSDTKRRGLPSVHAKWGIPIAITAGDLLFAKVYESVLQYTKTNKLEPVKVLEALDLITQTTIAICEGQALDVMFEDMEAISEDEYFKMIGKKTASLLKASAQVGAIVGGGSESQIKSVGDFAFYTGLAFQIIDDILGLTADEKALGKPVGSDIREGKRTLIMIYALKNSNKDLKKQILSTLGNSDASLKEIQATIEAVKKTRAIKYSMNKAKNLSVKAKRAMSTFPASQVKDLLLEFNDHLVKRKH
jgi:geranylgeranyl diphosphate synthase type I